MHLAGPCRTRALAGTAFLGACGIDLLRQSSRSFVQRSHGLACVDLFSHRWSASRIGVYVYSPANLLRTFPTVASCSETCLTAAIMRCGFSEITAFSSS